MSRQTYPELETRHDLLDHIRAHPVEGSLEQKRQAFLARLRPPRLGTPAEVGGTQGLLFGELRDGGTPAALYLHGGGYVLGSPAAQALPASRLADYLGAPVFSPAYPLAPEATWPTPLDAVLSLIDALDTPVTLIGSSAGGHLALNAALRRPGRIRALALFSPNTDRTGRSNTREANTPHDAMNSDEGDHDFYRMAMPDTPPEHPDASPLLADLSALPPTFLSASEGEVLLGDTLLLARALEDAGVAHTTRIAEYEAAGFHMFESWPDILPEGDQALRNAAMWLKEHSLTVM